MDVVVSRCAGIDIGKSEVVACVRVPGPDGQRVSDVRTFTAFTGDVERLADWLAEGQVTRVVMEATGQYWKPYGMSRGNMGRNVNHVLKPHTATCDADTRPPRPHWAGWCSRRRSGATSQRRFWIAASARRFAR
jgi:Transposase